MVTDETKARWNAVADGLAIPEPAARELLHELCDRYSEPHRYYHTLPHVLSVLRNLDDLADDVPADKALALRLAAWYHDVVYDTRARDNEERSAEMMLERFQPLGVSEAILDLAARMIRATASHVVPANCPEAALLLDADLAILGAPPEAYDAYAAKIRREYAWVPEGDYRSGRTAVLASFLNRDRIFLSPPMQDRYEELAIRNLQREMETLSQ